MPSPFAVKLPPELLAGIFSHLTARFEPTDPGCLLKWIWTTHVCHYWRDVAINHARLWTTVFLGPNRTSINSLFFDLCFQRSGSLPVALLCDVGDFGWIEDMLTRLVLHNVTREKVKHLRIIGSRSNLFDLLNLIGHFSLSTFEMFVNHTPDSATQAFWLPHPPDHQFAGLTTLSTTRCAFELDSVFYGRHLTTLELQNLPTGQLVAVNELLSLIKRLPSITNLTLVESLRVPTTLAQLTKVKTLRSLHIVDVPLACLTFLSGLIAPNLEFFHVGYESQQGRHDTLSEVLRYANVAIRSPLPYTKLRLHTSGRFRGQVRLGTMAGDVLTAQLLRSTQTLNLTELGLAVHTNISAVGPDVYFLELEGSPDTYISESPTNIIEYMDEWKAMFSKFNSLRVLRFKSYRPLLLIETLFERAMHCIGYTRNPTSDHLDCFGTGTQLLSHLETIEFVDFSFLAAQWNPENIHKAVTEYPLEDILVALVWAIKRHSPSKPPRISFLNCAHVDRHWVAELQRYTWVDCDNLNHMVSSSSEMSWLPPEETFDDLMAWYKLFKEPEEDSDVDS